MELKDIPEHFEDSGFDIMSNFDRIVDLTVEKTIKGFALYAGYPGWDFHGSVWYEGGEWYCKVKVYGSHVDTVSADNLEDLMSYVSDKHGYS